MSKDEVICSICLKPIDKKDSYYLIQSYKLGTYIGRRHYHWHCFTEKYESSNKIINKSIELVNKLIPTTKDNAITD